MNNTKVDIKFGYLCNNKCLFCVQGNKREIYGNIDKNEIIQKIEDGRQYSGTIVFTGGEVTIRDDFFELISVAKKLDYQAIQIQTNGRMFSDIAFCEKAIKTGATEFSLALHGHVPELHDYLTKTHGSFYQTIKGIKNLKKLGQYVGTNTVITKSNFRNLHDLADLLIYLDVDQFQLAFIHAVGASADNFEKLVPRYSLIEPFVKEALSLGINKSKTVMTEAIPYCFMSGYTDYIAETIIPKTKIYDINILNDYTFYRINEGKAKDDNCKNCCYFKICEGPWKEYPQKFGWSEFVPVIN